MREGKNLKTEAGIAEEIRKTGLLRDGGRVTAGVSGGADSVFLFFVLLSLREEMNLKLRVVHVHHGIRGAEADGDAAFVEALCDRYGVEFRLVRRDIPAEAAASGCTLEEAGRNARREILLAEAEEMGGAKIALAHHRDDLAETVLFRIARGTGIGGLAAMRPERGPFIRPLLGISREEIEASLRARGISWREDATNREMTAARNRIRHVILPALERLVNPAARAHLAALASQAAEVSDYLGEEAARAEASLLLKAGDVRALRDGVSSLHPALSSELLRRAAGSSATREHVLALRALLAKEEGAALDIPDGLRAVRVRGGILFLGENAAGADAEALRRSLTGESGPWLLEGEGRIAFEKTACLPQEIPRNEYTNWADCDKITHTLAVRTRRNGDFLTVNAAGGRKSLSDYFTDMKVPKAVRDRVLLVADGSEIVWIPGMRPGSRYRIGPETTHAVKMTAGKERIHDREVSGDDFGGGNRPEDS